MVFRSVASSLGMAAVGVLAGMVLKIVALPSWTRHPPQTKQKPTKAMISRNAVDISVRFDNVLPEASALGLPFFVLAERTGGNPTAISFVGGLGIGWALWSVAELRRVRTWQD